MFQKINLHKMLSRNFIKAKKKKNSKMMKIYLNHKCHNCHIQNGSLLVIALG